MKKASLIIMEMVRARMKCCVSFSGFFISSLLEILRAISRRLSPKIRSRRSIFREAREALPL